MVRPTYEVRITAYQQRNSKRYRGLKGPITLHEAIKIATAEWRGRHLSEATITAYLSDLKEFSAFAHKVWSHPCYFSEIDKFKCADYRSYLYSHEEWTGTTLQRKIDSLSALFKVLVPLRYAEVNPIHLIESGEDRRKRVPNRLETECPVGIEDIHRLFSLDFGGKWGLRDRVLFYILIFFAPRNVELQNLRWWHLDGNILTIPRVKHNLPGTFAIPDFLVELFDKMRFRYGLNGDDPIFISQYRTGISPNGLRYILKRYQDKLQLAQLRPKDFRTLLLTIISKKWDPRTVQAFIGHLTPETANKFYERRTRTEIQSVFNVWFDAIASGLNIEDVMDDDDEEFVA